MKVFAIDYLSDLFGKEKLAEYTSNHITGKSNSFDHFCGIGFANFISYIINREIDLADSID